MATIADVTAMGYETGLAHGSVEVEQQALDAAVAAGDPGVIVEQAWTLTSETMQSLANSGNLPESDHERKDIATQIADQALVLLTDRHSDRVAFHERAVEIAKEMPDVWHVRGWGNELYVSCKDDGTGWDESQQELLDALVDPGSHAERVWQDGNRDAMDAATVLQSNGYLVERPELGADAFAVDGKAMTAKELLTYSETAEPKATVTEQLADAILADPGIADVTKKTIRAALDR